MAWEQRGRRFYYYLKKREGVRVRSIYFGRGDGAHSFAETAAEVWEEENQLRASKRARIDAEAASDRVLTDSEHKLMALVSDALCAAGYHKHKGQWRKKRNG